MGLLIHYANNNTNNDPRPTRLLPAAPPTIAVGLGDFEQYLKAQKKRNIKQIICYAQRYHGILKTGDASALVSLSSGALRRHAMEALTAYAKYSGLYEEWCQIRKRYSLHWTNGDESLQAMHKFFDEGLSFDDMLSRIKEMISKTPSWVGKILRFAVLTGLRPTEVCESVRLLNAECTLKYYNPERQALEHFRFPSIFLRQTKKAFISFVTPEMIETLKSSRSALRDVPSYNAIRHACRRSGINMDMRYCRKIFASHLRQSGIQPEVIDMLQGRVSQSVLTRHYLVPKPSFKEDIIKALEQLQRQL